MSSFLIVSDEFYPYENASTNCLLKVLQQLVALGHDVTVLCCAYDKSIPAEEIYKGCNIRRIHANQNLPFCYSNFPFKQESLYKKLFYFFTMLFGKITKERYYKKTYKTLKQNKKFDYILSILNPPKNHALTYRLISKNDKWIPYNFDPYTFNMDSSTPDSYKKINESIWSAKAYKLICAEGILEENERRNYNSFKNSPKLSLPLPNFNIDRNTYEKGKNTQKTILRYTGVFYSEIRNPDILIKTLQNLDPAKFSVEFYGGCCDYLKQNYIALPKCFELKGCVSVEECHRLVETADILINLCNKCPNQIPSKTFEYIATGKPILNFYYNDTDPSLPYLKRYPSILNLKQGECIQEEKLLHFLELKEETPKDVLEQLYHDITTEEITKRFLDFIEK